MAGTVLNPSSVFNTLIAARFEETGAIVRGLRSAVVETAAFDSISQGPSTVRLAGFTADTPAIVAKPLQIGIENFLQLSGAIAGFDDTFGEVGLATQALSNQLQGGLIDSPPSINNGAGALLQLNSFLSALESLNSSLTNAVDDFIEAQEAAAAEEDDEPDETERFLDFTQRPTEGAIFGSTFTGLATDDNLDTLFASRVAAAAGEQVNLASLIQRSAPDNTGVTDRRFIIDLRSAPDADGTIGSGTSLSFFESGVELAGTQIERTLAELSNITVQAAGGGSNSDGFETVSLDYINIIEYDDVSGDDALGAGDERGSFQTIAFTSNLARQEQSGNEFSGDTVEDVREFVLGTEAGTAFSQLTVNISDLLSGGVGTDALSAIQNGELRVLVTETLLDGTVNTAVTDLFVSSSNQIVAKFAFGAAELGLQAQGISVELRALNSNLDISGATVFATFP